MGRLLRHALAFWAILWFAIVAIPLFPMLFLIMAFSSKKRQLANGQGFIKIWSRILLWGFGMWVVVRGKKNIPKDSCIFVVNHVSMLDILANTIAIPANTMWLSKKEVEKIPVVAYPVTRMHILVDRSSKESRKKSMRDMAQALEAGHNLNLYPEGTRNKSTELLKSFFDGAFILAVRTQKPLVPITILDNWKRQNPHEKLQLRPGRIRIVIDEPIDTTGLTEKDIESLKEQVASTMRKNLEPIYGEEYSMSK